MIKERLLKAGLLPWLGAGAAIVIIGFGLVVVANANRPTTPGTGSDNAAIALAPTSTSSPSASASASVAATPTPAASATHVPQVAVAPASAGHGVLVDHAAPAGHPTWESQPFRAPKTWTISYTYDCGGNGGHFTVAAFGDTMQYSPVDRHGDKGSGTATIASGGTVYIATDTTIDCSWHVTARG